MKDDKITCNEEAVKEAIRVMHGADNLNMNFFQGPIRGGKVPEEIACSVEDLHSKGLYACFAGYLSLDPYFQNKFGLYPDKTNGVPTINEEVKATRAISTVLGIPVEVAVSFMYNHQYNNSSGIGCGFLGYGFYEVTEYSSITKEHVIEKLELLLKGEL